MSVGEGTAGERTCEWTIAQKTSSASSVSIVSRSRSSGSIVVADTATRPRCGSARSAAPGRRPPRSGRRRSGRTPRSGTRRGRGRSIASRIARRQRGRRARGGTGGDRRSPPVDAALERLLHLVEVRARTCRPRGTSSRRRAAARRSSRTSIVCASRAAATSTAPHDGPAKMPSRKTRSRSAAIASRFETRYFASSSAGSKISGMKPSSSERRPWTCSPGSGSAATIRTPGLCSRR